MDYVSFCSSILAKLCKHITVEIRQNINVKHQSHINDYSSADMSSLNGKLASTSKL